MVTNIVKPELYELGFVVYKAEADVYAQRESEHVTGLLRVLANELPEPDIFDGVLAEQRFPTRASFVEKLRAYRTLDEADRNMLAGAMIWIAHTIQVKAVEDTD